MDLKMLASDISKVYMKNPKVEAVLLGGSVARNWNDKYSDIELFIFWKGSPSEEERKDSIHAVEGEIIDFHPYEDKEWSETYITQGVKLEISNFLTSTIEDIINDVIIRFDINIDKQCLVASIHDGIALNGEGIIRRFKEKVNIYPRELSIAMINNNIYLGNRWSNREALVEREDWLMLYRVMTSVQNNIMGILFGLNSLYVHHPAFKWQKQSLLKMAIAPENISDRLSSVLIDHPKKGVKELEGIIQEIYGFIESEFPTIDLSKVKDKTQFLRPKQI